MGRIYAGVLGTLAMVVVLCRGVMGAGGVEGTLTMATLSMIAFAIIGSFLGYIAEATIEESVRFKIEQELAAHTAAGGGESEAAT